MGEGIGLSVDHDGQRAECLWNHDAPVAQGIALGGGSGGQGDVRLCTHGVGLCQVVDGAAIGGLGGDAADGGRRGPLAAELQVDVEARHGMAEEQGHGAVGRLQSRQVAGHEEVGTSLVGHVERVGVGGEAAYLMSGMERYKIMWDVGTAPRQRSGSRPLSP